MRPITTIAARPTFNSSACLKRLRTLNGVASWAGNLIRLSRRHWPRPRSPIIEAENRGLSFFVDPTSRGAHIRVTMLRNVLFTGLGLILLGATESGKGAET